MNKKTYYLTASILFTFIAIVHLLRGLYGWGAEMGGVMIPVWFSWAAFILAGYLATRGFHFVLKRE